MRWLARPSVIHGGSRRAKLEWVLKRSFRAQDGVIAQIMGWLIEGWLLSCCRQIEDGLSRDVQDVSEG
jgi:hypothetical protein